MVSAAATSDTGRAIHAQSPTGDVERVNAVVAEFAIAPMPEPMPVVMDEVVLVRAFRRGALPESIIKPLRHRRRFAAADGGAEIIYTQVRANRTSPISPPCSRWMDSIIHGQLRR